MSEHEHEFSWKPWFEVRKFVCVVKDCHAILTTAEAEQRLNATEKLSGGQAKGAASSIRTDYEYRGWEGGAPHLETLALEAYAAAREGIE